MQREPLLSREIRPSDTGTAACMEYGVWSMEYGVWSIGSMDGVKTCDMFVSEIISGVGLVEQ